MKLATIDLEGPVHYADFGGSGPPLLLVHGLGGSHANWLAVAGQLSARYRVLVPDLIGFGRTPLAGRSPSVASSTAMIARLLGRLAGGPSVVAGNSMGGLVSATLAADRPDLVSRLILVNAALPRPLSAPLDRTVAGLFLLYMTPFFGAAFLRRRIAKVGPEGSARDTMRICGVNPDKLPPEVWSAQLEMAHARLAMPWANDAFVRAARSVIFSVARRDKVHAMLRRIVAPTLLIHGTRDRLVPMAAGEDTARVRPDWTLEILDGVGHVPQLQVPERWLGVVNGWLDRL
jgi:pimeloyl-ACP methyl ester carboxylesterase